MTKSINIFYNTDLKGLKLTEALNWYMENNTYMNARKHVVEWLIKQDKSEDSKKYNKLPEANVSLTVGGLCNFMLNNSTLSDDSVRFIDKHLKEVL